MYPYYTIDSLQWVLACNYTILLIRLRNPAIHLIRYLGKE
jgi:hypothetical protein